MTCSLRSLSASRFSASTRNQFGFLSDPPFVNPLDPSLRCGPARLDRCRLMSSKMRPQMLSFANADGDDGRDVVVMYKKGDDLRQDRLTLQLLKVGKN